MLTHHRAEGRGCRETLSSSLSHRDSRDAVELPLPLNTRWYSPAMCQGYLNERGMTVASPDSWQEPGRGGRGEWMLRLHQLCLLYVCMYVCMYVGQIQSQDNVCEWVNEWETCFAGDVCWFRKCSFVFAMCLSLFILSIFLSFLFLTCFGRITAIVCTFFHLGHLFASMCFHSVSFHL